MRRQRNRSSLLATGEPWIWITSAALAVCIVLVLGLLVLVAAFGFGTFWPAPVVRLETETGQVFMGEETRSESYRPRDLDLPAAGAPLEQRRMIRTGNFRLTQTHFRWVEQREIAREDAPEWAMVLERRQWGRFFGFPLGLVELSAEESPAEGELHSVVEGIAGSTTLAAPGDPDPPSVLGVARLEAGAEAAWAGFQREHAGVLRLLAERRSLERDEIGELNRRQERARLAEREAELELESLERAGAPAVALERARAALERQRQQAASVLAQVDESTLRVRERIEELDRRASRFALWMRTAGEAESEPVELLVALGDIVRAYPANRLTLGERIGIYLSRWWEFLTADPREANSEGGVFPAIFGTAAMTLLMSVIVVPFGVMAALYLREYARGGLVTSAVRIAVNNLAGVPSIVFGVFGLGFFCMLIGSSIDQLLFSAELPSPTYGTGGLLWASLTLALLTLPVVIVATEEALAAVPGSLREASYACGASKWQTIRRIVLPRAMPGIMTGMILAIARGAGEVAPLMLVGAVKLAPELPIDGVFPYFHPERSFMHLGFHIYDVGFQSQNSEAARPMVYTTTLLLIAMVALLNLLAVWMRSTLRRRYVGGQF